MKTLHQWEWTSALQKNSTLTSTLDPYWIINSRFFLKQSNKWAPLVRKLHLSHCSLSFLIISLQILHHSVRFRLLSVEQMSKTWNRHEFIPWLMFCFSRFSVTHQPPVVAYKHILCLLHGCSWSTGHVYSNMNPSGLWSHWFQLALVLQYVWGSTIMEHGRIHRRAIKCNPCTCYLKFKDIMTHVCLKTDRQCLG